MYARVVCLALATSMALWSASSGSYCEPAETFRASSPAASDPADFDRNIEPFLKRQEGDLFAHERYQDAVHRHGVEGHLRALTQEYQTLALEHAGDPVYRYLYTRTL